MRYYKPGTLVLGFLDRKMCKMGVIGGKEVGLGSKLISNHNWIDRRLASSGEGGN